MAAQRARRIAFLKSVPWIEFDEKPHRCAAISRYTRRAGYRGRPCANRAHWHFTALRQRGAYTYPSRSGWFCMTHLYDEAAWRDPDGKEHQRFFAHYEVWKATQN